MMADLFERLDRGRPSPPIEKAQEPSPAQKLLDWLQRWSKPTISIRDVHIYGPGSIRNRKSTIEAAEVLAKNGWLVPDKAHRYDMRKWQIVRKPIAHPIISTE
jgi:hypothetical protein